MPSEKKDKLLIKMRAARQFMELYECRPSFSDDMIPTVTYPFIINIIQYRKLIPVQYIPFYYNGKKVKIHNLIRKQIYD